MYFTLWINCWDYNFIPKILKQYSVYKYSESTILGYTGRFDFPQQSRNSISFAAANMQQ